MKHFEELYKINVNDKTEKLKQGGTSLTYLSWTWAWAEVKKMFPDASYRIEKFLQADGTEAPYMYDPKTGYMVMTSVTLEGLTHEMWLPVMDGANKAMKAEPYTYKVKDWKSGGYTEKEVQPASMFDINKTIMRCLAKNLAMFGLGLYIYAGEDLPEGEEVEKEEKPKKAPKIDVQEAPRIETPQRIPEIESKFSLLIKRSHLHSLMDNKTWEDLIKKQGEPNTWTEEQLDRWIKKLEGKNADGGVHQKRSQDLHVKVRKNQSAFKMD